MPTQSPDDDDAIISPPPTKKKKRSTNFVFFDDEELDNAATQQDKSFEDDDDGFEMEEFVGYHLVHLLVINLMVLSDATDALEVSMYNEVAESAFGMKASALEEIRLGDECQYKKRLYSILFQSCFVRIRSTFHAKTSTQKFIVTKIMSIEHAEYLAEVERALEKLEKL